MTTNPNKQLKTTIANLSLSLLLLGACSDANGYDLNNSTVTKTGAATRVGDMETYSEDNVQYASGQKGRRGQYRNNSQGESLPSRGAGRRFKRGAPAARLLNTALSLETLSNAQRGAIRTLIDDQKSSTRPSAKRFDPKFQSQLADAIRSGNVDNTLFSKHQEMMDEAREIHVANQNRILETLHDTLSEAQRNTLAERIRTRMSTKGYVEGRHRGGRGNGRGRFHRGQNPNCEYADSERPQRRGRGIFRLAQDLNLTTEQQAAIDSILESHRANRPSTEDRNAKRDEMRTCHQAFLDAFVTEAFDAATHRCPRFSEEERESRRLRRTESMIELTRILTDSQREQLAERVMADVPAKPL